MNDPDRRGHDTLAVGQRICLRAEPAQTGLIIDDFGEHPAVDVVIGDDRLKGPRRWAVRLDSGHLRFLNTADLSDTPASTVTTNRPTEPRNT